MNMAMYNAMYIVYIMLVSASFFAFILTLTGFDVQNIPGLYSAKTPVKRIGGFLVFLSSAIALLWLQIIITPLMDGSIIPKEVEHYTTLTVQGFDLSIFLPSVLFGGLLLIRKNPYGYLIATVTLLFLCLLMTALVAKIIAMTHAGVNVIPVIFIIPAFDILAMISTYALLKNIKGAA